MILMPQPQLEKGGNKSPLTAQLHSQVRRRTAIKLFGAAVCLPWLNASAGVAAAYRPWKIAFGLNGFQSGTHKYKKNYPIWEVLDFASHNGFDGIELVSDWPAGGYPSAGEADRIRALRRLYDSFGLRIFSIQLGAAGAFAPEAGQRQQWLKEFRDRAQFAKQAGCDCVGLWPGGGLRGQTIDQAIDRLCESFRDAGKIAGDLGLLAAFEIEPPFVFNTEAHYKRILDQTNHPALKGIYDPSHFDLMNGSTGRPHELLRRVGVQHIGYVHFTDSDGTLRDGGTSKHLACGDGHVDIAASLRTLREGGFSGWIMIDSWEIPDPYDACLKGKQAIERAMAAP
jgi:sugar phosphate isomerase/epimerase